MLTSNRINNFKKLIKMILHIYFNLYRSLRGGQLGKYEILQQDVEIELKSLRAKIDILLFIN